MSANIYHKTFFDAPLLVLWGESNDDTGRRPRFTFGFRDGRPRFVVNTGHASGKEGMIIFPSDVAIMTTCMLLLDDIAKGPADSKIINESLAPAAYVDNKPTPEKKVRSTLIFGKTKEGVVYITVIAENYPKNVFQFTPSDFTVFRDSNKQEIPKADLSVRMAQAFSEQVRLAVGQMVMAHAHEEYANGSRKIGSIEPRDGGSGNGGGKGGGSKSGFESLDDLVL